MNSIYELRNWILNLLFHRENCLIFASFSIYRQKNAHATEPDILASITVDDVRDVINVSSVEIPDIKVLK
jgi:hypothetical protein